MEKILKLWKKNDHTFSVSELVRKAKKYNNNLGNYLEHFINEDFNFSVRLDNGFGVIVSRRLAQDFSVQPIILKESDLINIAKSAWKLR